MSLSNPTPNSSADQSQAAVRDATRAVSVALRQTKYAVIGGAACMLLGSSRLTRDVDFVVPMGQTAAARQELRNAGVFTIESKTLHTYYQGVEIEILTPPALFKELYNAETPTMEVQEVRVLKPALILNAKCRSVLGRADGEKKRTDAEDILFLLRWFVDNPQHPKPTAAETPNVNIQFHDWFIATYCRSDADKALWAQAGFKSSTGTF